MTSRPYAAVQRRRPQRGFVLLLVLSILVLLSAIALHLSAAGRTEARIAFNLVANAKAESLADAGISRAVFGLLDPIPERRWELDGTAHRIKLQGGTATVTLRDENDKINPNLAPEGLMFALLQAVGVEQDHARHLAAAIADWVSPGTVARPFGAKAPEYADAGLPYGPPNAPLESIGELARVLGMTPEILDALRPYLSVFSIVAIPNPQSAAPAVQQAIEMYRSSSAALGLTGIVQSAKRAGRPIVAVTVAARTENGAVFIREAVFRLESQAPKGYVLLAWQRGDLAEK